MGTSALKFWEGAGGGGDEKEEKGHAVPKGGYANWQLGEPVRDWSRLHHHPTKNEVCTHHILDLTCTFLLFLTFLTCILLLVIYIKVDIERIGGFGGNGERVRTSLDTWHSYETSLSSLCIGCCSHVLEDSVLSQVFFSFFHILCYPSLHAFNVVTTYALADTHAF
jgi:hypothetical protein